MMYKSLVCVMLPFCQLHCGGEGEAGPKGADGKDGADGKKGADGSITEANLGATCKTVADKNDADANKKDLAYAIAKAIIATDDNAVTDYTEKDNLKLALKNLNAPGTGTGGVTEADLAEKIKDVANLVHTDAKKQDLGYAIAAAIKDIDDNNGSFANHADLVTALKSLVDVDLTAYVEDATLGTDMKTVANKADSDSEKIALAYAVAKAIKATADDGTGGTYDQRSDLAAALGTLNTNQGPTGAQGPQGNPGPQGIQGTVDNLGANAKAIAEYASSATQAEKTEQEGLAKAVANSIKLVVANAANPYTTERAQLKTDIETLVTTMNAAALATLLESTATGGAADADKQNIAKAVAAAIEDINDNGSDYPNKGQLVTALKALVDLDNAITAKGYTKVCRTVGATVSTTAFDLVQHGDAINNAFCQHFKGENSADPSQTVDCGSPPDIDSVCA